MNDITLAAMERGLTLSDIKGMTIVSVVEFCDDYNKRHKAAEKTAEKPRNTKRAATQAEIDAFLA